MTPPNSKKSPYRKMKESERKRKRNKEKPVAATQAAARGKCGGKRRGEGKGKVCQKPAGWGTTHPGIGKCKFHGGMAPNGRASAAKQEAIQFMGAPKDISPLDAIIWCIKITAGEVEWLGSQIAEINAKDEWYEHTVMGRQMHVLQRARAEAQDRLVKYSKDAIALGLAERAVRLAEQFGSSIAKLLEGIANDLVLTGEQQKRWPVVVRKHLIMMQGGSVRETGDKDAPLVALPRRASNGN